VSNSLLAIYVDLLAKLFARYSEYLYLSILTVSNIFLGILPGFLTYLFAR
jgi:hypothetical protein